MLFGRETELGQLEDFLTAARAGRGGTLALLGEAGMGKTSLLAAARERAGGMRVAAAAGDETEANLPFAALGDLAKPFLDGMSALPQPQAAALGAALALSPPGFAPADRLAIFAGFLGLLSAAAEHEPLLVLVDDAQWLDPSSADCLAFVTRRLEGSPVALLVAARSDEERPALPRATQVRLAGIDGTSARALLARNAPDLAPSAADAIVDLALGNPLALRELPPLLDDEQRRGLAPPDPAPAPGSVLRDAFERRLARLGDAGRAALLVAAAASDRALTPVVGACADLGIARDAFDQAEADELVSLAGDEVAFAHPLLRAVVYQGAPPPERRRAHRALAARAEGDERAWQLAAAAVGPDEETAAALEAAAGRATMRGAHRTAADALERAARASEDAEAQTRRRMLAGFAAALGASFERAAALLEPVADVAAPELRAHVRHLLALVTVVSGRRTAEAGSQMLADEAERIAEHDPATAAQLYADAALTAEAAAACTRALELAERAGRVLPDGANGELRCQVLATLGMARALRGETAAARAAFEAAGALIGDVPPLSPAMQSIAFALHARNCLGQHAELRREAEQLTAGARAAGVLVFLPYYLLVGADAAHRLGDWPAAGEEAEEALAIAEDTGQAGALALALIIRGRIHAGRGEEDAARADLARAAEIAAPARYVSTEIWTHATLGTLSLSLGRPADAIAELERARALCEAGGLEDLLQIPWAPDLVEAYVAAGRVSDAEALTAVLTARAERAEVPLALALAARCAGMLPGDFDRCFERALQWHAAAGAPLEHSRTLLAYGARLHRARRRIEARERLREALDGFDALGAAPWAARARHELRAAGAKHRDPATDPDELTAQEIRIALAVARGATNREVAAELFLSPKTIEFHLGRVYRKLDVRSRVELAALAAEGRLR